MQDSLLIELLTEELPPKSLQKLAEAFASNLTQDLKADDFVTDASAVTVFATPRRLAVHITGVAERAPDRPVIFPGPAVSSGLDKAGNPTPALLGFAKKNGVTVGELIRIQGAKGEQFAYQAMSTGGYLATTLDLKVKDALKQLPISKVMRWGDSKDEFVRPVHRLLMLHGSKIIGGQVLGLQSSNRTLGHRFLSEGEITITAADDYEKVLEENGSVISSFEKRRSLVKDELRAAAGDAQALDDTDLLDEVTALVEYPVVYAGQFDAQFLSVPQECLTLSMKQHQKYFPLFDASGKLLPRFLFVSNNRAEDPGHIIHGNERVLRARLSDAKFFFEQDKKTALSNQAPKLANVVYHNKLGSQLQRVERIQKLAVAIAGRLKEIKFAADIKQVERAAYLCKADLLTDMVGEFPELQGIMGRYYALHDGEAAEVAEAIREHYERVPESPAGICVGLADKLDTLAGIYGIGLIPTGDKDPFGLRRAALSVLRTLMENNLSLNLMQLLEIAEAQFPAGLIAKETVPKLYDFMLERLKPYLRDQDCGADEIEAVLSLRPTRMDWIIPRLKAIQEFRKLPEAEALAAANKRIRNILRQAKGEARDVIAHALLKVAEEKHLAQQVELLEKQVTPLVHQGEYTLALKQLAALRPAVDAFFDKVMVMVEDAALRDNRLALLTKLEGLFMRVADISKLHYGGQP